MSEQFRWLLAATIGGAAVGWILADPLTLGCRGLYLTIPCAILLGVLAGQTIIGIKKRGEGD